MLIEQGYAREADDTALDGRITFQEAMQYVVGLKLLGPDDAHCDRGEAPRGGDVGMIRKNNVSHLLAGYPRLSPWPAHFIHHGSYIYPRAHLCIQFGPVED